MWRPSAKQFTSLIRVQHRVETLVNGAPEISYVDAAIPIQMCEFKPFYGAELIRAGTVGIEQGGTITMWYDPSINVRDRVLLNDDPEAAYEVVSVENVENRGVFLVLKVRRIVNA